MEKKVFAVLMTVMVSIFICAPAARAAESAGGDRADRTILLYDCGADLETESGTILTRMM